MEIKSAKGFVGFLATFLAAGAAWLWASAKVIDKIVRGRK